MIAIQFVLFYGMLAILGAFLGFCMLVFVMRILREISKKMDLNNWHDKNLFNRFLLRSTVNFFFRPLKDFDGKSIGNEFRTDYVYSVENRFDNLLFPFLGCISWVFFLIAVFIWAANGVLQYYSGGM